MKKVNLQKLQRMKMALQILITILQQALLKVGKIIMIIQQNIYQMMYQEDQELLFIKIIKTIKILEKTGRKVTEKVQIFQVLNTIIEQSLSKAPQVQHTQYQQKLLHNFKLQLIKNYYQPTVLLEHKFQVYQHQRKNNNHKE